MRVSLLCFTSVLFLCKLSLTSASLYGLSSVSSSQKANAAMSTPQNLALLTLRGTTRASMNTSSSNSSSLSWPAFKLDLPNCIALIVSALGAILANAAGVGGGGMFVPMFTVLGFDAKTATALSQAMIFGGALVSFLYNIRLQHPTDKRPLIDYDIALLLEPMLLLGISVGVVFNIIFPSWLIVVLLTILLTYMTYLTLVKGIRIWSAESAKFDQQRQASQMAEVGHNSERESGAEETKIDKGDSEGVEPAFADVEMSEPADDKSKHGQAGKPLVESRGRVNLSKLKAIWMTETSIIPKRRLAEVVVIWLLFLLIQVLKGGSTHPSIVGVRSCQSWFWILVSLQVPLCVFFTVFVARRLHLEFKSQQQSSLNSTNLDQNSDGSLKEVPGKFLWNARALIFYPMFALVAGTMAGLLGIGGGMVIGPLLLELGVLPQVTAATGALMVLFSSSMAVAQFAILNLIPLEEALIYGGVCAVFAYIGLVAVRVAIAKYGRTSIIIFALAIVIGISAVVIAITGGISVIRQIFVTHSYLGFDPLCVAHN